MPAVSTFQNVWRHAWFLLAAFALPTPAVAATDSWPVALRRAIQRTATVEWRLRTAAARTCPAMAAGTGLVLDSLDAYDEDDRAMVSRLLWLADSVQVAAVAEGSPADVAGIRPGDAIVALDGRPLVTAGAQALDTPDGRPAALQEMDALARLIPDAPVAVTLRSARTGAGAAERTVQLVPQRTCAARVFVSTKNTLQAYTDGVTVIVTARLVDFTASDDELAILLGHEMGHILAHDVQGDTSARRMEDRADIVGADLAACAGYDAKAAAPFWQRYEKTSLLHFIDIRTVSPGRERVRNVRNRPFPPHCPIKGIPPVQ